MIILLKTSFTFHKKISLKKGEKEIQMHEYKAKDSHTLQI